MAQERQGFSEPPEYSQVHSSSASFSIDEQDHQSQEQNTKENSVTLFSFKIPFISHEISITLAGLNYFTFMLIGMANLWPWNCFLSASEFFSERLKDQPVLANLYSSTMMTVSTTATTLMNIFLSQRQQNANYENRLKIGNYVQVFVFLLMSLSTIVHFLPSIAYFIFVMISVCLSSAGCSLIQVGCLALVNTSGPIFANAVVVGNAVAGVLPSIALTISILAVSEKKGLSDAAVAKDESFATMIYFLTACGISGSALIFRYAVHKLEKKYKQYKSLPNGEQSFTTSQSPITNNGNFENVDDTSVNGNNNQKNKHELADNIQSDADEVQSTHVPFMVLWNKLNYIAMSIFITFAITLVFPVFASSVTSSNEAQNPDKIVFQKKVFIPLAYLTWNLGDLFGRIVCAYPKLVISKKVNLLVLSIARVAFIVVLFLCNVKGRGGYGIFNSDFVYFMIQFLFGLTNGYLFGCCFQSVPNFVHGEDEQRAAGGFTAMFVSFGLSFGSVFSYLFVYFIK